MKQPVNYITNKKLYNAMIGYRKKLMESIEKEVDKPKISDYIGESIFLICENLLKKGNFSGYTTQWKQEMLSDGVVDCVAAVDNFDPDKTNNPFGYFTMIAWNAYIRRIMKEKRHTYIKHKNFENNFLLNDDWSELENANLKSNDFSNDIIQSFEDKLAKTKKEQKSKAAKSITPLGDDTDEE